METPLVVAPLDATQRYVWVHPQTVPSGDRTYAIDPYYYFPVPPFAQNWFRLPRTAVLTAERLWRICAFIAVFVAVLTAILIIVMRGGGTGPAAVPPPVVVMPPPSEPDVGHPVALRGGRIHHMLMCTETGNSTTQARLRLPHNNNIVSAMLCEAPGDAVAVPVYDEERIERQFKAAMSIESLPLPHADARPVVQFTDTQTGDLYYDVLVLEVFGAVARKLIAHKTLLELLVDWETQAVITSGYPVRGTAATYDSSFCMCPAYFGILSNLLFRHHGADKWEIGLNPHLERNNTSSELVRSAITYDGFPSAIRNDLLGDTFAGSVHYQFITVAYDVTEGGETQRIRRMLPDGHTSRIMHYLLPHELVRVERTMRGNDSACYHHCADVRRSLYTENTQ